MTRPLIEPYYADDSVTLYHGDCREILPHLGPVDCVVADPPYVETAHEWDRWPAGWPELVAEVTRSMWCFGSMRMFLDRAPEFRSWKFSQDIVWEKHNGSGFAADRFKRVHEHVTHWYLGPWATIHHDTPTTADATARQVRRKARPAHMGYVEASSYSSDDGGPRLMRSVIPVRSMHGKALKSTQKPVGILVPPIRYACPPGGTVLDPFAGSGSTAEAARLIGRKSILIEVCEADCELIVQRMSQGVLA